MKKMRPGRLTTAALSLAAFAAAPVLAQDGTGIRGNLSFSTGLEVSDNPSLSTTPDGTTLSSVTDLGFSLSSATRVDSLNFSLGASVTGEEGGSSTSADALDISSSSAALSYTREGINSRLGFSGRYDEANLDDDVFGFFVDGVFDPDALIIEGGTRKRTRLSADFTTGLNAPFGIDLSLAKTSDDYVDTSDPDLVDRDRQDVSATARFEINPALTARVSARFGRTDTDDLLDTSRRTSSIGAGLTTETRTGLEISTDVSLDSSERLNGGVLASDDDGVGFEIGVTQPRVDGEVSLRFSSRIDDSGRRTSASVSRDYAMPAGALSLSIGVVDQEDQDIELTTRLDYTREAAGGTLTANLIQSPTTNDGSAFLNTSVGLGYVAPINSISSWSANFSYGTAQEFGASGGDARTSAAIRYTRDLSEEWDLDAGLRHVRISEDGAGDRTSSTLFVNVGRDFSFGF